MLTKRYFITTPLRVVFRPSGPEIACRCCHDYRRVGCVGRTSDARRLLTLQTTNPGVSRNRALPRRSNRTPIDTG